MQLKIRKIDVIAVYPQGRGKFAPATYFGKKWAICAYELTGEIKVVIDVPLPPECDAVHPVAVAAINREIKRGAFTEMPEPVSELYKPKQLAA